MNLKSKLLKVPKAILSIVEDVGMQADRENISAYLVGGFVRDLILSRKNFDLDFVVEGDAIALSKKLNQKYQGRVTTYAQFGTATIFLKGGGRIDIATARKETYPHPGALPVVENGTIGDDLFRRDFTINAIALSLNAKRFAEIVDPFDGLKDLKGKKIRILHDKSFQDDPTRILRAIRFEQRFKFSLESKTLLFFKKALKNNAVKNVKMPRYFEEFKKIFEESHPEETSKRLSSLGGLKFINARLKVDGELFRTLKKIAEVKGDFNRGAVYWFAVTDFLQLRSAQYAELCQRFNLDKSYRGSFCAPNKLKVCLRKISAKNIKPSQIYLLLKPLSDTAILFLKVKAPKGIVQKRIDAFLKSYQNVRIFTAGEDLKKLGFSEGRKIGEVLQNILLGKLDGEIRTQNDETTCAEKFL